MDDRVNGIVGEDLPYGFCIAEIHLHQRNVVPAGNHLHAVEAGEVAVGEIIGDHHIVACLNQFHGDVAPDETRPAGHKHCLFHIV